MKKNLENKIRIKKIKIIGYKEITPDEFFRLRPPNQGLRVFDYYDGCTQLYSIENINNAVMNL